MRRYHPQMGKLRALAHEAGRRASLVTPKVIYDARPASADRRAFHYHIPAVGKAATMNELRDLTNSHRHAWSKLNRQQVGAYAEYFFKMEFTMAGFQVYSSEVDDRGIDFVVRHETGPFREVQIKSARIDPLKPSAYVFMQKSKFGLRSDLLLGLALFCEGREPDLFLIPATRWETPDTVFCDRPYGGTLKSKPEWGVSISRRGMPMLSEFKFDLALERLI